VATVSLTTDAQRSASCSKPLIPFLIPVGFTPARMDSYLIQCDTIRYDEIRESPLGMIRIGKDVDTSLIRIDTDRERC
jgi:hypothetical protein